MALTKVSTGMLSADVASIDLNIDANTMYIDVSNNRVGINNAAPSTALDVTGSVTADGLTVSASATDFEGVQILNTNTAASPTTASILLGVTNSVRTVNTKIQAIEGGGDANETSLAFFTNTGGNVLTKAMTIDWFQNVGIGVSASLQGKLNVGGDLGGDPSMYVFGSRGAADNLPAGHLTFRNVANGVGDVNLSRIQSLTGTGSNQTQKGQLAFSTNNGSSLVERMRIDASGNVGIGVTPSAWGSYYSTINAGSAGNLAFFTGQTNAPVVNVGVNLYNDNTNFRYAATGAASFYQQYVGQHRWYNVASGGVGNIATPVQAMTLDASGNLLVGKTGTAFGTAGVEASASNGLWSTRSGFPALALNRLSTEGSIADFYKDGASVGSIGVSGGNNLYISGLAASHSGLTFATNQILPSAVGAITDGAESLGNSSSRFQDLYLSGGAYLGGVAAANKLDDYEEGTFNPILLASAVNPSPTYGTRIGKYTKVGNVVNVFIYLSTSDFSGGSGDLWVAGLPFAASQDCGGGAPMFYRVNSFTETAPYISNGNSYVVFLGRDNTDTSTVWSVMQTSAWTAANPTLIQFQMTYFTS